MHNEFLIQFISGVILEVTLFLRYLPFQFSAAKRRINAGGDAVNLTVTKCLQPSCREPLFVIAYETLLLALADKLRINNSYRWYVFQLVIQVSLDVS